MSEKRKPDAASFKIAQEIVKKYDSEYTLVSLIAEAITAGHPAPTVQAVGEMWSPEDAVEDAPRVPSEYEQCHSDSRFCGRCGVCHIDPVKEGCPDATPRAPLLERAASWKESDLRKFPAATLELIDALAAALRAAPAGPTIREAKTGELESWVRLVPHVGHKEFKGSFESTTEFSTGCVRCNLEKLTQGPTIRTLTGLMCAQAYYETGKKLGFSSAAGKESEDWWAAFAERITALRGPTIRTPLNEWDKAKVRYAEAMLWYSYGRDPLKTNADWDKFRAERMAELHKELDRIEALAGPTIREVCEGRDDA